MYHELHLIAYGINQIGKGWMEYQGWQCSFENEDGVFYISDSGEYLENTNGVWSYRVSNVLALEAACSAVRRIRTEQDPILMEAFPFRIEFAMTFTSYAPADNRILILDSATIPGRQTKTIPVYKDEYGECKDFIFCIGNLGYPLSIRENFGYVPKQLEVSVEIDTNTHITIFLEDKTHHKEAQLTFFT